MTGSNRIAHIGWIDLLRIIACFFVVLAHCCDAFIAQFDADRAAFLTGVFTGSLFRFCVPIFVMMTGVLLLPVNGDMVGFYKKRIGRIIPPLIFWSVALPLLYFVYLNYVVVTDSPLISMEDHTAAATLPKLYTWIFNFNFDTVPLWYLYMLIGLYLVMPVISVWLKEAPKKDVRTVLYIWGVSLVLPYVKMFAPLVGYAGNYGNTGILGVCDWSAFGTFYYFTGYIGYLLLAYYLVKYPLQWSWKKTLGITIPMFVVGYLVTSFGYVLTNNHFPGNYAYLEIVWDMAGINVFMMTFPVFVIAQKLRIPSFPALTRMASMMFGVYLCHYVFVQIGYDLFDTMPVLPVIARILGMSVFAFAVSYLIVRTMYVFKFTRIFVR